jgi:hypothetical protein
MPRYYFDFCESDEISIDDVGLEFPDLAAAKADARRALSELFSQGKPSADRQELTVMVRDERGEQCLKAKLIFEAVVI